MPKNRYISTTCTAEIAAKAEQCGANARHNPRHTGGAAQGATKGPKAPGRRFDSAPRFQSSCVAVMQNRLRARCGGLYRAKPSAARHPVA